MRVSILKRRHLLVIIPIVFLAAAKNAYTAPDPSDSQATFAPEKLSACFRKAVDKARPAIVTVKAIRTPRGSLESWMQSDSIKDQRSASSTDVQSSSESMNKGFDASGSGIIFDSRGYVLTCNHVVAGADSVWVNLEDGRRFEPAKILTDPLTDIAVIQLAGGKALPAAICGNSDDLQVGDWIVSIGNPYGLGISVSAGIVSATERQLANAPRTPLIQTDAGSNPGTSGGAVIDLQGRVVGISEGGYGVDEGFQGIGFAIPINVAKRIASQLIESGHVPRAYLGCRTEAVDKQLARHLGVDSGGGIIVSDVNPNSPASRAGIEVGDVVTHIGSQPVRDDYELFKVMERTVPGEILDLDLVRDGHRIPVRAKLVALSTRPENRKSDGDSKPPSGGYFAENLGLTLDELTSDLAKRLGYSTSTAGVLITHVMPNSSASKEGVRAGMAIIRVANQPIHDLAEFRAAVSDVSEEKDILLLVATPHREHFVLLQR
jgi:serine protease Do